MNQHQLEIQFDNGRPFPCPVKQDARLNRAQRWFALMRLAVNTATDWRPSPVPPPVQGYLTLVQDR